LGINSLVSIAPTRESRVNHDAHNDNQKNNRSKRLSGDFYFDFLIDACCYVPHGVVTRYRNKKVEVYSKMRARPKIE